MSVLERIAIGVGIIVLPIIMYLITGIGDVLVSEMLTIPLSLCFFTGKGVTY